VDVRSWITFSNGAKLSHLVPVTYRFRRLYHFVFHAKLGSSNWEKLLQKIRKEFWKQKEIKRGIINEVATYTTANYSGVVLRRQHALVVKFLVKGIGGTPIGDSAIP